MSGGAWSCTGIYTGCKHSLTGSSAPLSMTIFPAGQDDENSLFMIVREATEIEKPVTFVKKAKPATLSPVSLLVQ